MKTVFCVGFAALSLAVGETASAATAIFTNPITGTNPNTSNPYTAGQTFDANITVSGIGRGSGINGTNSNDRFNATGWSSGGLDLNDYFTWTLTPNAGYKISFDNFVYTSQASATGPVNFAFRSSVDSFGSNIGSPSVGGTTISLAAAAYQNVTAPMEFRFYGFGASMAVGTFSINSFTFNGTVAALPVSSAVPLPAGGAGALALLVACAMRRRVR